MDPNKIIDALGGSAATARLFGIRQPSVSDWRHKGIPRARLQTLALLRPDLVPLEAGKFRPELAQAPSVEDPPGV